MGPIADQLLADAKTLNKKAEALTYQPDQIANGANELLDEVAHSKITGEEDRYSHTDLYDFEANVDGAKASVDLLGAAIRAKNPALAKTPRAALRRGPGRAGNPAPGRRLLPQLQDGRRCRAQAAHRARGRTRQAGRPGLGRARELTRASRCHARRCDRRRRPDGRRAAPPPARRCSPTSRLSTSRQSAVHDTAAAARLRTEVALVAQLAHAGPGRPVGPAALRRSIRRAPRCSRGRPSPSSPTWSPPPPAWRATGRGSRRRPPTTRSAIP